jgi:Xaa-Pro aminopeptidase
MDFGSLTDGYCSDMTRTVALCTATDEMKQVYDTVLRAQLAGIKAARAGIPGMEIDAAARRVINGAGFGAYFGHGFGHCLGLDIHEPPFLNPTGKVPMPENSVCSAEPGIYIPGRFGVRIEDVLILRADGCENITRAPKTELLIVGT